MVIGLVFPLSKVRLSNDFEVYFQWILSHVSVDGNEKADSLEVCFYGNYLARYAFHFK